MPANTILADINEIWVGYKLNENKWFDQSAKTQYDSRVRQSTPEAVDDAQGKAEVMARDFIKWAMDNGYKGRVEKVWWTARPNSMSLAVGRPVDQNKNPADILVKFTNGPADGFLGLSAKATKGKADIGFKNPGVGTIDRALGTRLADKNKTLTDKCIKELGLPNTSAAARKVFIRSNPSIKQRTEQKGSDIMSELRDDLIAKLKLMPVKKLRDYLLSDWMDAEEVYPPYIKVTGTGNKEPYGTLLMDPLDNPKLSALMGASTITLTKEGNESIGVAVSGKKIMKMRFKYESEKLASSLKMSGDPW